MKTTLLRAITRTGPMSPKDPKTQTYLFNFLLACGHEIQWVAPLTILGRVNKTPRIGDNLPCWLCEASAGVQVAGQA